MEMTHIHLDALIAGSVHDATELIAEPEDREYYYWVILQMVNVSMTPLTYDSYARHITGVMRALPNVELFPLLFIRWCCIMAARGRQINMDMLIPVLNLASDLLHLPAAHIFLDDGAFYDKLNMVVQAYKSKNAEFPSELMAEIQLFYTRHAVAKKAFIQTIKEDLVAKAMHPDRIERLINTYGIEVLESI
jgi:hypothetical protein